LSLGFGVEGLEFRIYLRYGVYGSGFRVQGSGFRVQGSGFRVQGSGFRVQGSGFRVQGSGFRVQGSGFRVQGSGFISPTVESSMTSEVPSGDAATTTPWIHTRWNLPGPEVRAYGFKI
jgi:hypothetical protein